MNARPLNLKAREIITVTGVGHLEFVRANGIMLHFKTKLGHELHLDRRWLHDQLIAGSAWRGLKREERRA